MRGFLPGQRWVSDSEPELGLGVVLEAGFRDVKIHFPAAGETRVYMQKSAPLRRVRLQPGDRARSRDGRVFAIRAVEEKDGLFAYRGDAEILPEGELLDRMAFSDPDKRLLAGKLGKPRDFRLRLRALELRRQMLGSPVRGLAGARMELLPHQLSIAAEVAARHRPRVLLCDEVGLGKTIEAGLIFHRLHATGQIRRVLIVTPSQLVYQWMVEMYRRFHHMFTVLDEDFCRAEEKGDASKNPFALRQTVLCDVDFLAASDKRVRQAGEAGVDLLIVDEAHHLQWSPERASPAYQAVETLARTAGSVLLLTATPIQLGQAGHFGRLRLLDPNRFTRVEEYLGETGRYQELAALADIILASETPASEAGEGLLRLFPGDAPLRARVVDYLGRIPGGRSRLIEDLVDRHGTGRLMFRNRRQAMGGFPGRVVHPVPLDPDPDGGEPAQPLSPDPEKAFAGESDLALFLGATSRRDPRLAWLVEFLKENPDEKVLLLCAQKSTVFALQESLPTLTTAAFASFHENLAMATRDRNAAYFAERPGAQMLICSEIGSEGRNFQFARHLVLFDLPLDPSVLEQRIGRLDRIGQKGEIHIHVPYVRGTAHETVFRWYHEGLDAFRETVLGSDVFHGAMIDRLLDTCRFSPPPLGGSGGGNKVAELIRATQTLAAEVKASLEKGRDRLLEINSNKAGMAESLIAEIRGLDADPGLENLLEEVFDHFGLDVQETAVTRGYFVFPGERMLLDSFPGIPEAGLALTYDRAEALVREDMAFLSIDHPLVRGAVDLLLEEESGTAGFVEWRDASPAPGSTALEAVFVLEAAAPADLHLDRFLPPTPVRVLVGEKGENLGTWLSALDAAVLEAAPTGLLEERHEFFAPLMRKLLESARREAASREMEIKKSALQEAGKRLFAERDRLHDLRSLNPSVSGAEVEEAGRHATEVSRHIAGAELRLDSVRLILMGKPRF